MGLGSSPLISTRPCFVVGSGTGTAERRASVYGCIGFLMISSAGAISTMFPRYITAMRWLMYRVTETSWETNMNGMRYCCRRLSMRFMMPARMLTSSMETASSATTNSGRRTRARALGTGGRGGVPVHDLLRGPQLRALQGAGDHLLALLVGLPDAVHDEGLRHGRGGREPG